MRWLVRVHLRSSLRGADGHAGGLVLLVGAVRGAVAHQVRGHAVLGGTASEDEAGLGFHSSNKKTGRYNMDILVPSRENK